MEKQRPYKVWGSGKVIRDFIHTQDLAEGGLFLLQRYAAAEPVNIASGRCISIEELAQIILKIAGHQDVDIEFDALAPPASNAKRIDVNKMQELGFQPGLSLEEGLIQTITWYKENHHGWSLSRSPTPKNENSSSRGGDNSIFKMNGGLK